jgi:uncharacterized protein (DUF169 family)
MKSDVPADVIERFLAIWRDAFAGRQTPIAMRFAPEPGDAEVAKRPKRWRCWVADLAKVRRGRAVAFADGLFACSGASHYAGFSSHRTERFPEFLSTGAPGGAEGERYKRSPEIVVEWMRHEPTFAAPATWLIAEPIDRVPAGDRPDVICFVATPDVLSGLFTWANFLRGEPNGVIAPFGAGCASLIQWPMAELEREDPRAVLGMLDVSARPYVPPGTLSFSVPWPLFVAMVATASESFLWTRQWGRIRERIAGE